MANGSATNLGGSQLYNLGGGGIRPVGGNSGFMGGRSQQQAGHPYYWPKGEKEEKRGINVLDILMLPFKLLGIGPQEGDNRDPDDPREMALGDLAARRSLRQRMAGWTPGELTEYRQRKQAQRNALYPPTTPTTP